MNYQASGKEQIIIEMTANRLVTRTMLKHLVADDRHKASTAIDAFSASIEALMSALHASGMSSETHAAVVGAVRRRAACMIDDLHQILVKPDAC